MSRPASYHDQHPSQPHYVDIEDDPFETGFSLPLFNPHHQPQQIHTHNGHPNPQGQGQGQVRQSEMQPPPPVSASQHRSSVSYSNTNANALASPFAASSRAGPGASAAGGPPLTPTHRAQASTSAAFPYSNVPYPQSAHPTSSHDELLPLPASTSGYLGRSASLGARKKDPFTYRSDDVESGFGNMDMNDGGAGNWGGGYGGGFGQQRQSQQGYPGQNQSRDVLMSPGRTSSNNVPNNNTMNPPPVPSHAINRQQNPPTPQRNNSNTTSQQAYQTSQRDIQNQNATNPYIPRGSDPGPSNGASSGAGAGTAQSQWADYRLPSANQRMSSTGSYRSHGSDQLSPYANASDPLGDSPLFNPYDISPGLPSPNIAPPQAIPTSPRAHPPTQWSTASSKPPPASPVGGRPPPPAHRTSQQLYPASQPVTPASKGYDMGPPRGMPSRDANRSRSVPSRQGLVDVHGWTDLKPVVNPHPAGRRADPNGTGKFLSPLKCLTTALPQTYTLCSPAFRYETSDNPRRVLTKPSKPAHNDGADNEDWDYILYVNDVLGGEHGGDRYLILDVLGQGTFGQVVKCQNMRTHDICAVKVVKNKPAYLNQSKMEVAILDLLNTQHDPRDEHHILRMFESFTHKNHLCLVFECLSSNLYELIKQNQFKGLSTQLVKVFTGQLLDSLSVLKDARLIHCDLKPENILLKSLQSPQIKVIDFGSACHEMQTVYTYIQSRFYRSPEVLLGLPYSTAIDMWSLGCIVVELFLGLPLFPGTSEYNQLSRITDMLGNPPSHLLEVGKQTNEFFNCTTDHYGRKQYKLKPMQQYAAEHRTDEQPSKQYFKQTKLKDIIMEYPYSKKNPKQSDIDKEMATRRAFVDFAEGLLNLDPIKRWSPQQAIKHPFVLGEKLSAPYQPSAPGKVSPYTASAKQDTKPVSPTANSSSASSSSKKYGGLVQSPGANRAQRIYSDAAAYNQQLAQHQSYTAQVQNANNAPRHGPFSPGYDMQQQQQQQQQQQGYGHSHRIPSQSHTQRQASGQWQPPPPPAPQQQQQQQQQASQHMGPPQPNYQQRTPSLSTSTSHASLRQPNNVPMVSAATNPPPNSYYPQSRNRANTINQMDAIPPALARLVQFGAPDPSGLRNSLTPVLNRDDAILAWERNQGHQKQSSLHNASYPQLEYLQEQAELAAMSGQNWMVPGPYPSINIGASNHSHGHGHGHGSIHMHGQGQGHRSRASTSGIGTQGYQMQPHIGVSPPALIGGAGGGGGPGDYRPRQHDTSPQTSTSRSNPSSGGNATFTSGTTLPLPTYPPAVVTSSSNSNPNSAVQSTFDAFGNIGGGGGADNGMGMMYTPLQPSHMSGHGHGYPYGQGGGGVGGGGGHSSRSSYSGGANNPFAQGGPTSPRYQGGQGQGQNQNQNQNQRRSGNYGP